MPKRIIGRFLGYEQELDNLRSKVAELSWDETYGMLTRGAFLQFCRVMPRGSRVVCFIDLDDIHHLNHMHGYTEVNRRVANTFSIPFRSSDLVARWFSGDEIVILFDGNLKGATLKIEQLQKSGIENGITFTYEIGSWEVGKQSIRDVIEELSSTNIRKRNSSR